MKYLLIALFALSAQSALAASGTPLPDGSFKGEGHWKSQKTQGAYRAETQIRGDKIEAKYDSSQGKFQWSFETRQKANGFFSVLAEGHIVGDGYCLDHAKVCHYEVKVGSLNLEETLVYLEGHLYRYGSKQAEGEAKVFWQEALQ